MVTHIPNKGEQTVRYYGFYSNKSRGLRKKAGTDDQVPALIDSDISPQAFRKNWARLIQKIYNVNPLLCSKCSGSMRIISLIDDAEIIKKILKHLDLWDAKRKPPQCANVVHPPQEEPAIWSHYHPYNFSNRNLIRLVNESLHNFGNQILHHFPLLVPNWMRKNILIKSYSAKLFILRGTLF